MAKLMQMISTSLKERVEKVVSKPKRRRIKGGIIASTEEHRSKICKELRHYEYKESQEQLVPVLFMWGKPHKILTSLEEHEYKALGMRVEYIKRNEAKNLIK
jgi:ASC-1-like (ASCH) protein